MVRALELGLLCVCVSIVSTELVTKEGSGDSDEMEDYDLDEGSGEFIEDLKDFRKSTNVLKVVPDTISEDDFDFQFGKEDDYYNEDEYNEILDTFDDYMYGDNREDRVLNVAMDEIINLEKELDIEIKPKPPGLDEDILLDTSQILIMIGSAFISFGLVMLAFFLCHQRVSQSKAKQAKMPYTIPSVHQAGVLTGSSPIVKDYQRVPTTTQEYLAKPHIEMYRGEDKAAPLLRSPSSGV